LAKTKASAVSKTAAGNKAGDARTIIGFFLIWSGHDQVEFSIGIRVFSLPASGAFDKNL
jgi:hypothetical protein